MSDNTANQLPLPFTHKEVVEALIRHKGLKEGIWGLYVEFALGAGNIPGPTGKITPSALVGVSKLGLRQVQTEDDLSVDAKKLSKGKKWKTASEILTGND